MYNLGKNNSPAKQFKDDRGIVKNNPGPYIATVKDNRDNNFQGRIRVWIPDFSFGNEFDQSQWRTVHYMSPYYGEISYSNNVSSGVANAAKSYGFWGAPPDVGTQVICFFVAGDPNRGFYIGSAPRYGVNYSTLTSPGTPVSELDLESLSGQDNAILLGLIQSLEATGDLVPALENTALVDTLSDLATRKFPNALLLRQLLLSGLHRDSIRGAITSSPQRETPNSSVGMSSPGRLIKDPETGQPTSRNLGHSIIMDDGEVSGKNNLMRFRTAGGHQITMSDDGQVLYISHSNGNSWMEFNSEGAIDVFAANSVNIRTKGEFNFHADQNMNFHAGNDIKMYAGNAIQVESEKTMDLIGKDRLTGYSSNPDSVIELKSNGELITQSKNKTSIRSDSADLIASASNIHLNTTLGSVVTTPKFLEKTVTSDVKLTDNSLWEVVPASINTIAKRTPTHEPYPFHNLGSGLKIDPKV